jgi:hypothetical protein
VGSDVPGKLGLSKNLSTPGNIQFAEVAFYEANGPPNDVASADIYGDGKADLAISNDAGGVTIVRNTFGEDLANASGHNAMFGAITQDVIFDSIINTYKGRPYAHSMSAASADFL